VVAKKLGGGYASTVHLAIDKATGTQVAIKVYHRCKLSQLNNYQVQREIRIHSCLDHKNVLQLVSKSAVQKHLQDSVGIRGRISLGGQARYTCSSLGRPEKVAWQQ
jgi:serine/threonine protein kinase